MSNTEKLDEIHTIIDALSVGMLVTENGSQLRSRPMSFMRDHETGFLWALTRTDSGKTQEIARDHDVNVAFSCPKSHQYVSVTGRAVLLRDPDKINDMWSMETKQWFGCDKEDPSVAAVCVTPSVIEYWTAPSSTAVRVWELMKAKIADEKPDMGENGKVRLAR